MRVLVTGARGMLGQDVVAELTRRGVETIATDFPEVDITNPSSLSGLEAVDWCINCAAYTAVDRAESEEEIALRINRDGVAFLRDWCKSLAVRLLHISTDFVFDGTAVKPYLEDAPTNPLSAYGRTKLAGEQVLAGADALIVRTAWLYGPHGKSFPRSMQEAFLAGRSLRVVADQVGNPTYTADLARVLVDLISKDARAGIYHAVGPETMNWHEFAVRAIAARTGSRPSIEAIRTEDWPTPAVRPKYSALSFSKLAGLGIEPMRPVDEALAEFTARL